MKTDDVIEQHSPMMNVEAVRVQSMPLVGYNVAKNVKKEDRRNIIAPSTSIARVGGPSAKREGLCSIKCFN